MKFYKKQFIILAVLVLVTIGVVIFNHVSSSNLTVNVLYTSNTQAILNYIAPDSSSCTIEVSKNPSYLPVIDDASSTLYSLSNIDLSRPTTIATTTQRTIVIGKRVAETALDGNRHSRALQAFTTYFYRITCNGGNVGTGSFLTMTIPTGNTYSDIIPNNGAASSTWPTISAARNESYTDPQTGLFISKITTASDTGDAYYPTSLSFGSFGGPDVCNNTLVTDNTGALGYHCIISGLLLWINPTTGVSRPVGVPMTVFDGVNYGNNGYCSSIDTSDPNRFYCIGTDISSNVVISTVQYSGLNTIFTNQLPVCTGSNQPCVNQNILTPGANKLYTLMHNFDNNYDVNFNVNGFVPIIRSVQNGKILMDHVRNIQDNYAWLSVFNPGNEVPVGQASSTAQVAAMMSTVSSPAIRWCSDHTLVPIGQQDYMLMFSNNLVAFSQAGGGYYSNHLSGGTLSSATSTCPGNPFGALVCSTVTVDGEPCNSDQTSNVATSTLCGDPNANFLQTAIPGDVFGIDPISRGGTYNELVQLISKSGNTWTIARGLNQTPVTSHSVGTMDEMCTAHSNTSVDYYSKNAWFWNYINDPHGVDTTQSYVFSDLTTDGTHSAYRPTKYVDGVDGAYKLRSGIPSQLRFDNGTLLYDINPGFAGITGIGSPNTVDSHASPFVNNSYFLDGRPMLSGLNYSAGTSLGSGIYKYASGAITLHRKTLPTFAYSNVNLLKDITATSSDITSASNYSYCYVDNAGECKSGSLVGEVYAKSTTATESDCPFPGVGSDGWGIQSICIGDNAEFTQGISQVGANQDLNGKNSRLLTHSFTTYNREDVFWNVRSLPDASNFLFTIPNDPIYGNASGQVFMGKLPPFTIDSVKRNDFYSIPITIASSTGATGAKIKFGYLENGNPTDFFCTSRQEACIKANQATSTYDFLSATTTAVSCTSGCTINIPAIPDRVVYYQVQYYNAGNNLVGSLPTQVTMSEQTYVSLPSSFPVLQTSASAIIKINRGYLYIHQ